MNAVHRKASNIVEHQGFPVKCLGSHESRSRIHNTAVNEDGAEGPEDAQGQPPPAEQTFAKQDTGQKADKWGTKQMIGGMSDYGFMQYIFSLCLVFACCIRRPISIETLFFLVVLMAEIRNVYVWWAILMMFAATKYFLIQSELNTQNERTCFY